MSVFSAVPTTKLPHNVFTLTHSRKMTTDFGRLTPCFVMDVVPGDKISVKPNVLVKFAPMVYPVMHQISAYVHMYYVPNRILFDEWYDFISGGEDGLDSTTWPYITVDLSAASVGSIHDYMGLPVGADIISSGSSDINALPFAAYQAIYNEYYRDQNLIDEVNYKLEPGANTDPDLFPLRQRAWQHDYLTSGLPWAQKGVAAMLPLGTDAPIVADTDGNATQKFRLESDGSLVTGSFNVFSDGDPAFVQGSSGTNPSYLDLGDSHIADLSSATAATILELRRAIKLQEWLERNARSGSRDTEYLKAQWNVNSSDSRLNRPEYIGGLQIPIKVSEILQTSFGGGTGSFDPTPLGSPAGHAFGASGGEYSSVYCEEHGYIIGILSVMPKTAYQQGIPRHFLRSDKFDYFTPPFEHIGEQAVLNKEVAIDGLDDEGTFSYVPRYSEYKFMNDSVHGEYRTTLDRFHLGRKFATMPALNQDFIECDPTEVERIFAVVEGSDPIWVEVLNEVKAQRPMAVYGDPKF